MKMDIVFEPKESITLMVEGFKAFVEYLHLYNERTRK